MSERKIVEIRRGEEFSLMEFPANTQVGELLIVHKSRNTEMDFCSWLEFHGYAKRVYVDEVINLD